jgi:hypothetical protein
VNEGPEQEQKPKEDQEECGDHGPESWRCPDKTDADKYQKGTDEDKASTGPG